MLMTIFSTFPTINISKRMDKHLRVIWIAKDFIYTALKPIISIFRFFEINKYCQILSDPNKYIHQWKAYLFSFHVM